MMLCGRPTRNGTPCRLTLWGEKCPTHDVDLSQRNRKVTQSFRDRDPQAFRQQRAQAGKKGYQALCRTGRKDLASAKARQWRLDHPSGPERRVLDWLIEWGIVCEREYPVGKYYLDFAWPDRKLGLEVNGHQGRASFGETTPRRGRQGQKMEELEQAGWQVLSLDWDGTAEPVLLKLALGEWLVDQGIREGDL